MPQTHGRPNTPLPPMVHQFIGTNTPVNFWVKFIIAIAAKHNDAFNIMDLSNL